MQERHGNLSRRDLYHTFHDTSSARLPDAPPIRFLGHRIRHGTMSSYRLTSIVVALLLVVTVRQGHADYPPFEWVYDAPEGHLADVSASFFGYVGLLTTGFGCGLLLLPVDGGYKLVHPDEDFGRYSKSGCMKPAEIGGDAMYLAFGFPVFALQEVFWNLPHRLFARSDPPHSIPPADKRPETCN